jgi:hypothetical protein
VTWSAWLAQIEPGSIDQNLGRTERFETDLARSGEILHPAKIGDQLAV